jgi:ABC-type transport system substrate-binding protein
MSSPRAVVSPVDGVNRKIERMNSRWKHSLFAAVASACLIGKLAPASAAGTLLIAREADSTTFDPIATQQNPDCWIYPNIFAGLVKANVEGAKIEPNLAESWTSSPDGLTYTFKLRPGLKFSDDSPLKASDVRFSILKLQAREVDAAIILPFNRVAELQKTPGLTVHLDASTREGFLIMNEARKPFDDVDVRKAINMALDRKAIVEAVAFGVGEVANSFISKGALYHNAANKDYSYDPAAAKAAMQKAGVTSAKVRLLITAGDSSHEQMAVLMKDQLAKIGVELVVTKKEQGQAFDTITAGDYDLAIQYRTNDIIDPDEKTAFSVYGDDTNKSFYTTYKSAEVTKLVDDTRSELDSFKCAVIYNKIQQIVKDDAEWVDLFYSPYRNVTASYVKNFTQNPLGGFTLEDTTIEK